MAKSKRKKNEKEFTRHAGNQPLRARVLIVTEGSVAEPAYFKSLRKELGLSPSLIRIEGDGGSAPKSVVNDAMRILDEDDGFEQIYCVFDRDQHDSYDQAIAEIGHLNSRRKFKSKTVMAITSIISFEFWLLLYFCYSTKPYSASTELDLELDKHDTTRSYKMKNYNVFFQSISKERETAVARAEDILKAAKQTSQEEFHENPSTRIHYVIKALEKIKFT